MMTTIRFFCLLVILMAQATVEARDERGELIQPESDAWLEATSIDDVLERWPRRVDLLLDALDLDRPDLAKVKAAVEAGDKAGACRALLDHYKAKGGARWVVDRLGKPGDANVKRADQLLANRVPSHAGWVEVPSEHGAWDWNHTGPKRNREFAFQLNRHAFFLHLLQAYRKTGDEKYARAFDQRLRDWVLHTQCPGKKHAYVWTWRVLEAGLRMRSWTASFHGFLDADAFSPAGRLLMLASFVEHGRYIRMHHWNHHNHALMEFDGLNRLGLALPELAEAEAWHEHALERMVHEMDAQVYPDGAHDELSSGYHWVSLHSYEEVADVCRDAGRKVPDPYRERLVDMYDYWAGLLRPDGSLPQNNRSDRKNGARRLLRAAERYKRPDWRYIATAGAEGEKPQGPPSRFAPYAGHLVSRSGWGPDAMWSFFDAGPAGAGWVHADATHLSVSAFGKDFLVDSGRFWYMRDRWTRFAHAAASHNLVMIDGCDQAPAPKKTDQPLGQPHWAVTDTFDFARKTHDQYRGLEGEAAQTRIVVFLRGVGWVVVDHIQTDRPRKLTAMWRYRPERQVQIGAGAAILTADDQGANLSVTPLGPLDWKPQLVRGREDPSLQGWYSEVTTEWAPNTCAELNASVNGDATFAWIILPTPQGPAQPAAQATFSLADGVAVIAFDDPRGRRHTVKVPLERGRPEVTTD